MAFNQGFFFNSKDFSDLSDMFETNRAKKLGHKDTTELQKELNAANKSNTELRLELINKTKDLTILQERVKYLEDAIEEAEKDK